MTHSKKIVRNTVFSVLNKIATILVAFVTRKLFIVFLSEELLGLNSLFTDLLGLLNLADMGLGVAVQFNLYRPIAEKDNDKIARILNATKRIYNIIGISVIAAGVVISFFIQYLIKENPYPLDFLRIVFIINVISSAASYFFVHKRLYMQASEDLHITYNVDTVVNIIGSLLRIVAVAAFRNYYLFVLLSAAQTVISNFIVSYYCNKKNPRLMQVKGFTKAETGPLFANIKELIPNKISAYIFSNTDNTIISSFLGLSMVTFFTNYNSIILQVFSMAAMLSGIVRAAFGNVLQETVDKKQHILFLKSYQLLQFIYSSVCGIALFLLIDDFVCLWYGEKFVAPFLFVVILIADFFLHSMFLPLSMMLEVLGEFRSLKKQEIFSMILNIVVSVSMVVPFGIIGPIFGTFMVDLFTTVFRLYTVMYKNYRDYFWEYLKKYLLYIAVFVLQATIIYGAFAFLELGASVGTFLTKGAVCGVSVLGLDCLLFRSTEEFKYLISRLKVLGGKKNG